MFPFYSPVDGPSLTPVPRYISHDAQLQNSTCPTQTASLPHPQRDVLQDVVPTWSAPPAQEDYVVYYHPQDHWLPTPHPSTSASAFPVFPSAKTPTYHLPAHTPATPTKPRKRKKDENDDPREGDPPACSQSAKRRKYAARRTDEQKVADIFSAITGAGWTFGEFLYYAFRFENDNGRPMNMRMVECNIIGKFTRRRGCCLAEADASRYTRSTRRVSEIKLLM